MCQVLITETVDAEAASFMVWVLPFPSLFAVLFMDNFLSILFWVYVEYVIVNNNKIAMVQAVKVPKSKSFFWWGG